MKEDLAGMADLAGESPATATLTGGRRQAALGFIFVVALLDVVSLGIMIPVLPNLIKEFAGGDTATASTINVLFATSWGIMQFFCSPILGLISDRFGRRPVILVSVFGLGIDFLFMALAPSLAWLFIGRLINGACAASFGTAGAYIADVTPPEGRAKAFGLIGASWGVGFVLGPALGGWLGVGLFLWQALVAGLSTQRIAALRPTIRDLADMARQNLLDAARRCWMST